MSITTVSNASCRRGSRAVVAMLLSIAAAGCGASPREQVANESKPSSASQAAVASSATAENLTDRATTPKGGSTDTPTIQVPDNLVPALHAMDGIGVGAPEQFASEVGKLKQKPKDTVASLEAVYNSARKEMYQGRWKLVDLAAAIEAPEAVHFLRAVATSPIVDATPDDPAYDFHASSPRMEEEMIRSRAIVGLSRLARVGAAGSVEALEELLNSNAREVVIAAALELDLLGKLAPKHHKALRAHGLKTKFTRVDDSVYEVRGPSFKPIDPAKPAPTPPPALGTF